MAFAAELYIKTNKKKKIKIFTYLCEQSYLELFLLYDFYSAMHILLILLNLKVEYFHGRFNMYASNIERIFFLYKYL